MFGEIRQQESGILAGDAFGGFREFFEIFGGGDFLAALDFQCLAGVAGDGPASFGGLLVFGETLGVVVFGDLGGGGFAEDGEDEFQIGHVIAEVFFGIGEGFELFVFGRGHAEGGFADFRSEDGKDPFFLF